MYLKRLELHGYKTFAARTQFEFDAGITAIVGPNGSGKSNVADALRWVMGEQRYTALRAKRSEDMIFGGSQDRTRLGMADVSLTLDNSSGWLPIEYAEVTVQRRAFPSGENQYYLNGSRVRRRDIVELLAKGRVSSNTYTIIAQGAVDASLSMRPEQRRSIFEEAAGIAIHQAKRDQSLAKLEDTRNNILRVNDIVNEIAPRLERLSKQAQRAEEYQKLSRELEKLLETWYGYQWRRTQEQSQLAQSKEEKRQEALADHKRQLEETSRQIDQLRKRQAELRGDLGRWHSKSGLLHARLEELQRDLAVKRERHRLLVQRRDEIQQEVSPLAVSRETRSERIAELEVERERLAEEREGREGEGQRVRREMAELEDEHRRLEAELAASQDSAFELATGLAERRNLLSQLRERKDDLSNESREHEEVIGDLCSQLESVTEQISTLQRERDAISASLEELKAEEANKEAAAQSSVDRQSQLRARLEEMRQQLSNLETRNELLSKARRELTDYSRGVKTVLSRKGEVPGIIATVAELLEVPPDLDGAVEAALGRLLQAVVTETWEDARSALEILNGTDGGRATLLPLDSLRIGSPNHVPRGEGIIGLASELVGIREGLDPVLQALLGNTLVVEDLGTARRLHQDHDGLQFATLAGELLSHGGFVEGGSGESGSVLLAHERERRQLPGQIEALRTDWDALKQQTEEEEKLHHRLLNEIATFRDECTELEEAGKVKDEEIGALRLRDERASQEIEWHRIAVRRLEDEIASLVEKAGAVEREIEAAEGQERETADAMDSLQERLTSLDLAPLQEKLAGLRTAIAVLDRSRESQETVLEGHRSSLEQLESQLAAKESRIAELAGEGEELEGVFTAVTAQIEELSGQVGALSGLITPAEEELAGLEKQQRRLEKEEAKGARRSQEYEATYSKSVLNRQRREDELRNLQERIEADLETVAMSTESPRQLPLDIDARLKSLPEVTDIPRGLSAKIKGLRRRLRQVGPVDPETVVEYEQVVERHGFLVGQVEDLEKAGRSLRKVVAELDRLMEDKFLETFNKVAVEFEAYFPRLFNGGRGKLSLTDPENPLQSGVEILAQPPGRRHRSVAMLSGGERALTGVALTFAILKACSTPFCLLDEVDSRLDEVNIGRFRQALQELAERTQVIVITHNRGTVEIADAIYGVTMGRDSASRVLSLRLQEVEARAS